MMRRLAGVILGLVTALCLAWGAAALHFAGPRPPLLANALAAGLLVVGLGILVAVRPLGRTLVALAILVGIFGLWWRSVTPSNDRDWQPDVARTARQPGQRDTAARNDAAAAPDARPLPASTSARPQ